MNRFWIAMGAYAVLALLAWQTLTETFDVNGQKVPLAWVVWAILAMFALRTYLFEMRTRLEQSKHDSENSL